MFFNSTIIQIPKKNCDRNVGIDFLFGVFMTKYFYLASSQA
jgi:hypothetical protein